MKESVQPGRTAAQPKIFLEGDSPRPLPLAFLPCFSSPPDRSTPLHIRIQMSLQALVVATTTMPRDVALTCQGNDSRVHEAVAVRAQRQEHP